MVDFLKPHVGGPVTGPGVATVLVEDLPAVVVGDGCTCAGPPDAIVKGCDTVLVGDRPVARLGDRTAHGGLIVSGCATVLAGAAAPGSNGGADPPAPGGHEYRVKQGECVSSVAAKFGVGRAAIWDHPENAALRREREDPNVLYPGDRLFVPHGEGAPPERTTLKLRLLQNGRPHRNARYVLEVFGPAGSVRTGMTYADGFTEEHAVPAAATAGRVTLQVVFPDGSTRAQVYLLRIGSLDPVTTPEGVVDRLINLGYLPAGCGKEPDEAALRAALRLARKDLGLDPDKEGIDPELRDALRARHGC
jgi:uncharacterized Zn-binding protein involved in type VI secretion